jgi:hypothetical protein
MGPATSHARHAFFGSPKLGRVYPSGALFALKNQDFALSLLFFSRKRLVWFLGEALFLPYTSASFFLTELSLAKLPFQRKWRELLLVHANRHLIPTTFVVSTVGGLLDFRSRKRAPVEPVASNPHSLSSQGQSGSSKRSLFSSTERVHLSGANDLGSAFGSYHAAQDDEISAKVTVFPVRPSTRRK